jgi:hypothetical protein
MIHEKLRTAWEARQLGRSLRGLPPDRTPVWYHESDQSRYASECDLCETDGHLHLFTCPNNPRRPDAPPPGWVFSFDGMELTFVCKCGKTHFRYTGRECPCGEPFPHEFRA